MRQTTLTLAAVICALYLTGCNTTADLSVSQEAPKRVGLFADTHFVPEHPIHIESEEEIFLLPDDAITQLSQLNIDDMPNKRKVKTLAEFIFHNTNSELIYSSNANYTARQTFENQAANCLSLSILAYSIAQETGFEVEFQEIEIPEYWTHKNGHSLLNGHINVVFEPKQKYLKEFSRTRSFELDFDPFSPKKRFPKALIDKKRVLAMFYNNKGADALLLKNYDLAYAYFKTAIISDPDFSSAYTNLGVLYRQNNLIDEAKLSYKKAINITKGNNTAWHNLAILYGISGQRVLADEIFTTLHKQRLMNPYYHYALGNESLSLGKVKDATKHYRRAIKLDDSEHLFYFGLAKVYSYQGDVKNTERYLKLAKRTTQTDMIARNYQNKINRLND